MALVARCIFCGILGPWWECGCVGARRAQEDKKYAPKIVRRNGRMIIVVDEATAEANHFGLERYSEASGG
jgi:hypothetical protein